MSIKNHYNSRLSPEYVLLGFLYQSPSHGYELHQRLLDKFGNTWHASQSQSYNILQRLEAQGYIESTQVEQEKLPPRQKLNITSTGLERFEAWLAQPTRPSVHAIRVEFITRLYFTQRYFPGRTQEMIQDQVEVVTAGLAQLRQQLLKLPNEQAYDRLALELRMELLSSVIHWLEGCQKAFEEKRAGGQDTK